MRGNLPAYAVETFPISAFSCSVVPRLGKAQRGRRVEGTPSAWITFGVDSDDDSDIETI